MGTLWRQRKVLVAAYEEENMGSGIGLLIKNYDDADTRLRQVLESGSDINSSEIILLDKMLDTAFVKILKAELDSAEEKVARVRFLLSVLEQLSDDSSLASRLTEAIMADTQVLAGIRPSTLGTEAEPNSVRGGAKIYSINP